MSISFLVPDTRPTDDEEFAADLDALEGATGGIDFVQAARDDSLLGGLDDSVADKDYNPVEQKDSEDEVTVAIVYVYYPL